MRLTADGERVAAELLAKLADDLTAEGERLLSELLAEQTKEIPAT